MATSDKKYFWRDSDPLWYKDAIIYELHVRAFHDSDGDGMGDFQGLTEKLDSPGPGSYGALASSLLSISLQGRWLRCLGLFQRPSHIRDAP